MGDRCLRQNAVPKIEDEWSPAEGFEHSVDRAIEREPPATSTNGSRLPCTGMRHWI